MGCPFLFGGDASKRLRTVKGAHEVCEQVDESLVFRLDSELANEIVMPSIFGAYPKCPHRLAAFWRFSASKYLKIYFWVSDLTKFMGMPYNC